MNENYIVINGKKIELTEEQLKQLGIASEKKRKNPFDRVPADEIYFTAAVETAQVFCEQGDFNDDKLFTGVNYFNDEAFANQVALHQLLYRKLLKFAYDNECEDTAGWDCALYHYIIMFNPMEKRFEATWLREWKSLCTVYFNSKDSAERAIKEVVEPFMKEHPEFVW